VSKTSHRPPRLVCADCGGLLPQSNQPPLLGLLDRHALGLVLLLLTVVMPVLLIAFSPWVQLPALRRSEGLRQQRWDPRTGVVGRPAASHRQRE
jgi:hypothetical protein